MPIYAYKCSSCGHAKDVLRKISDAPLTVCPACGASTFEKQVTAAGFQLKGSGWYVTDFRNGSSGAPATPKDGESQPGDKAATGDSPAAGGKDDAKPAAGADKPADAGGKPATPAAPAPAAAAAPAPAAKPAPAASSGS